MLDKDRNDLCNGPVFLSVLVFRFVILKVGTEKAEDGAEKSLKIGERIPKVLFLEYNGFRLGGVVTVLHRLVSDTVDV